MSATNSVHEKLYEKFQNWKSAIGAELKEVYP